MMVHLDTGGEWMLSMVLKESQQLNYPDVLSDSAQLAVWLK